jgi:phenylacetate-CoA ligase
MAPTAFRDPRLECLPRPELEQLRLERLQATVNRAYRNVAFYHHRFEELSLSPEDIQSTEDLERLPLTGKDDLRSGYPYGMFAVPLREVIRIHMSSGTTGHPSVVGYTANDLKHLAALVARCLTAAGVTKDDVVQIFFGHGIFTAGFGFHYGTESLGASVIPVTQGNIRNQLELMRDFRTTVIVGTPSYALRLVSGLEELGLDPHALSLRVGLFGGEPWDESARRLLEEKLFLKAFDVYGLAEIGGPGVSFECEARAGLHVAEDYYHVEVVAPETGRVLGPGEEGELIFTTLNKEAFPLLRYRSGDLGSLTYEPCACGRTHVRMSRVSRHADDRLVFRGVNIFPAQVEAVLKQTPGLSARYQMVVDRTAALERLEVHVELASDFVPDQMRRLMELEAQVKEKLQEVIGLGVEVKLTVPGAISPDAPRLRVLGRDTTLSEG